MRGFVAFVYSWGFPKAWSDLTQWIIGGKLKYRQDVDEGFENLAYAFIGLFNGDNFGRKLVLIRRPLVLGFEIELDLHVVRIAEENLPTGAVGHLDHAVGYALAGEVLLHRLKAAAAKRDMIDGACIGGAAACRFGRCR